MTDFLTVVSCIGALLLLGTYITDQEHELKQRRMKEDFSAHCAFLAAQHAKEKEDLRNENQELEDDLQAADERIEELEQLLDAAEKELEGARNDLKRSNQETTLVGVTLLVVVGFTVALIFMSQVQSGARLIAAGGGV